MPEPQQREPAPLDVEQEYIDDQKQEYEARLFKHEEQQRLEEHKQRSQENFRLIMLIGAVILIIAIFGVIIFLNLN